MLYVSQLQGSQVWDAWSQPVGQCVDVLVSRVEQAFPLLRALALSDGGRAGDSEGEVRLIDARQLSSLYPSITLNVPQDAIVPYKPSGQELWLVKQVLDRQIVDTDGRRVVRVNDLQIARIRDQFRLTGVDVGSKGLLRRLGLERPASALAGALGRSLPSGVIPWDDVAPLQQEDPLRLRVSRDKITRLPPADIAAILNDLDHQTGEALATTLSNETLADALEESPMSVQTAVLSRLDPERAADILEEMGPDEVADLIPTFSAQTGARFLELMEEEEAGDVRNLLRYPVDSAGGIMTTEFTSVPYSLQAGQALEHLRRSPEAQEDEMMHYVYLVDEENGLQGVVRLRDLVMAPPDTPLSELSVKELVYVDPHTAQTEAAYLIAKYDLLALPVVDEESGELLGIVTVDDAIDSVLPTAWKKRLPRFS